MGEAQTRLTEMLVWLAENPADRDALSQALSLRASDVLTSMEKLEAKGYYEFLALLLLRGQDDQIVERATALYLAEKVKEMVEQGSLERELSAFKTILRTEMEKAGGAYP